MTTGNSITYIGISYAAKMVGMEAQANKANSAMAMDLDMTQRIGQLLLLQSIK
jgi:hypothetical protein